MNSMSKPDAGKSMMRLPQNPVAASVVLVAVTVAVFYNVAFFDFIDLDDPAYILENPYVQQGISWESLRWSFTAFYSGNWHPLTWISHMLDVQLYGLHPSGHHLTNLAFHCGSAVLLFLLLLKMTGRFWQSFSVAALFSFHPLHIESFAWVAERKDVLSAFFWMATCLAYLRFTKKRTGWNYALVLVSYAAGLMAKPMLVTLPAVLLLLDYWPLGRLSSEHPATMDSAGAVRRFSVPALCYEKLPLFLLAAASSVVTLAAQRNVGAVSSFAEVSLAVRLANACRSWLLYIWKIIYPAKLAILYPLDPEMAVWPGLLAALALIGSTALAFRTRRRFPAVFVGFLWYLVTLVPVIGIVQVGGQSMADRYTYIPAIGIFIVAAWTFPEVMGKITKSKRVMTAVAVAPILVLVIVSSVQIQHWRNSYAIFSHALEVTKENYVAENLVGVALVRQGMLKEAVPYFNASLRVNPGYADSHYNLAVVLGNLGATDEAFRQYQETLRLQPDYAKAHNNLGVLFLKQGMLDDAIREFRTTLMLRPDDQGTRENLEYALQLKGSR